jgi:hypothetical protein
MDLVVWLPTLFVLGVVSLGAMYAFLLACERV